MSYSSEYWIQQFFNGLGLGSIYALTAVGYTLVYGILRLINFAHGDLLMISAYTVASLIGFHLLPYPLAVAAALVFVALIGLTIERLAYRPLRGKPEETTLVTSLAVSILIQNLALMILSPQPRAFSLPSFFSATIRMGSVSFPLINIIILLITAILLWMLTLMIKKTKIGIAMRASAENLQAALLMGVNLNSIVRTAFVIGSVLAAVAGILMAGRYGRIDPFMGFVPGLKAFVAAVIGGIGSIHGAAVGGLILGFGEILFVAMLPPDLSAFKDIFVFLALILMLLVKPSGLFGRPADRRV